MAVALSGLGRLLAGFLTEPAHVHGAAPGSRPEQLLACLQPADVLLVESHSRVSVAIKYLSQSTWSHAALYVGSHLAETGGDPAHCFVEADVIEGVRSVGVDMFGGQHTRICRPIGLNDDDRRAVTRHAIKRLGQRYDLRNVIDLARYLLPTPPVPSRFRRRMIALGSGDPTRAICSTLIAQAFEFDQISDTARDRDARRQQHRLPRMRRGNIADTSPQPFRPARFRHFPLFSSDQIGCRAGLRFSRRALGRHAARILSATLRATSDADRRWSRGALP